MFVRQFVVRQFVVRQRHKIVSGSSSIAAAFVVKWQQMKACEDRKKEAVSKAERAEKPADVEKTAASERSARRPCLKQYYAYLLRCADGSLYAGYTTDLARRVAVHNAGKGAKYTRSRLPVSLVYAEAFASKEEALRRECALKRLRRKDKLALVAAWERNKKTTACGGVECE